MEQGTCPVPCGRKSSAVLPPVDSNQVLVQEVLGRWLAAGERGDGTE